MIFDFSISLLLSVMLAVVDAAFEDRVEALLRNKGWYEREMADLQVQIMVRDGVWKTYTSKDLCDEQISKDNARFKYAIAVKILGAKYMDVMLRMAHMCKVYLKQCQKDDMSFYEITLEELRASLRVLDLMISALKALWTHMAQLNNNTGEEYINRVVGFIDKFRELSRRETVPQMAQHFATLEELEKKIIEDQIELFNLIDKINKDLLEFVQKSRCTLSTYDAASLVAIDDALVIQFRESMNKFRTSIVLKFYDNLGFTYNPINGETLLPYL